MDNVLTCKSCNNKLYGCGIKPIFCPSCKTPWGEDEHFPNNKGIVTATAHSELTPKWNPETMTMDWS